VPYISAKEPCISAISAAEPSSRVHLVRDEVTAHSGFTKEPYIYANKPYESAKVPYISVSANVLFISAKEP